MEALRRALAVGFGDFDLIRRDPDLDALRSRADFQAVLGGLTKAGPGTATQGRCAGRPRC
jgi:hypothetical protein